MASRKHHLEKGPTAVAGDVFEIADFECIARYNDRAKRDLNTEKSQGSIIMITPMVTFYHITSLNGTGQSSIDPV